MRNAEIHSRPSQLLDQRYSETEDEPYPMAPDRQKERVSSAYRNILMLEDGAASKYVVTIPWRAALTRELEEVPHNATSVSGFRTIPPGRY